MKYLLTSEAKSTDTLTLTKKHVEPRAQLFFPLGFTPVGSKNSRVLCMNVLLLACKHATQSRIQISGKVLRLSEIDGHFLGISGAVVV